MMLQKPYFYVVCWVDQTGYYPIGGGEEHSLKEYVSEMYKVCNSTADIRFREILYPKD